MKNSKISKREGNVIYRVVSNSILFSFGEQIGDVPILGISLKTHQDNIVVSNGYTIVDVSDIQEIKEEIFISFSEDLYFSAAFFAKVVKASKKASNSLQFCLEANVFTNRFVLPFAKDESDFCFDFKYTINGKKLQKYYIEQEIFEFDVRMPKQLIKSRTYEMPQCDTLASHLISPFHLLQVNMAMNLSRVIKIQQGKIKSRFKNLKGILGVFFFYRALKSLNKIGANSFIHPSAIVEGSIIGDNVRIGANAIVRLSYLGNDCTISDNVVVANSVLGDKTYISNSNFIELCMTYEEAFLIHGPYQFSIFGKGSACFAVINCDFRLDQENIKIPTSKGIFDSNQPLMGIAYGHGAKVGGGNIIAAGRIVPNDRYVNPPDSIILKFD